MKSEVSAGRFQSKRPRIPPLHHLVELSFDEPNRTESNRTDRGKIIACPLQPRRNAQLAKERRTRAALFQRSANVHPGFCYSSENGSSRDRSHRRVTPLKKKGGLDLLEIVDSLSTLGVLYADCAAGQKILMHVLCPPVQYVRTIRGERSMGGSITRKLSMFQLLLFLDELSDTNIKYC